MTEPVSAEALTEGLLAACELFIKERSLQFAVGESGLLTLKVEMLLDRGRVRWTQGGVCFEHRISIGART